MKPIYCGFYTVGTPYEQEARDLEASLKAFGLETDIRPRPNLGTWLKNVHQTPTVIRDVIADWPGRPVVYLDADARAVREPVLFDQLAGCDVAYHMLDGVELLDGTMYFAPTTAARDLVEKWIAACAADPGTWEQKLLQRVIGRGGSWLLRMLPETYCYIFDREKQGKGIPESERVIVHGQASRRLKVVVGV